MIFDIYYIGAIIACIIAVIHVFKKISDEEEVPLEWITELSIVIFVFIVTVFSWVSVLTVLYEYLIDKIEKDNLH